MLIALVSLRTFVRYYCAVQFTMYIVRTLAMPLRTLLSVLYYCTVQLVGNVLYIMTMLAIMLLRTLLAVQYCHIVQFAMYVVRNVLCDFFTSVANCTTVN